MPKIARRNSALFLVAVGLIVMVFLLWLEFRTATPASYYTRCGPNYRVILLCLCAVAALACGTASIALFYSARSRTKGHPLNGITYSYAAFAGSVCVLALSPFFNLRNAPCSLTPALYGLVAASAAFTAWHTLRRLPVLLQVPEFSFDVIRASELRLRKLKESPETITAEENAEFAPILEELMQGYKQNEAILASIRRSTEGV